jgi:hypothetical protein
MSPQLSTRIFRSLSTSASRRRITLARFLFRSSERSHFSFHILEAVSLEEHPEQLVCRPQVLAGSDEGADGEASHSVVDILELPFVVAVKAGGPDPGSRVLAEEDPGEGLGAFGQAVLVIYKHRGVWVIFRACELQAADLDLQLDQADCVRGGAEVLPWVMAWQHNLPAVGHGGS